MSHSTQLEQCVRELSPGAQVLFLEETGSTNDDARKLAEEGSPEGTVVLAARQTAGRGRMGRRWSSPEGGLFMSVLLRPGPPAPELTTLPLVAGLAVAETVRSSCGLPAEIKWPNDVLVRGRKLAGILCEASLCQGQVRYVIAGIGVNANVGPEEFPPQVRETATSIYLETRRRADVFLLASRVYERLLGEYRLFLRHGFAELAPRIVRLSAYRGENVLVATPSVTVRGKMLGIDNQGRLLLELPDGTTFPVTAGDVSLRRA